ncbi:GntR family transcriptional regulator [Naasia sp. SYSU D00948]|uniref:GntR family transcriptional regulator n=1 Tax=Naasia sp. SYSU D00948 TaxID=2817379 RepID=UPI001B304C5D|nr:GntR family transcriptional regulator [Naasia sp. SYSU D00948]
MDIKIDLADRTPAGEQLRRQLLQRIKSGALPAQAKLPTVRGLAAQLGISPGTVAKVYRDLEHDGLVETNTRNGTTVVGSSDPISHQGQLAAAAFAERARALGLGTEEALALARTALEAVGGPDRAR